MTKHDPENPLDMSDLVKAAKDVIREISVEGFQKRKTGANYSEDEIKAYKRGFADGFLRENFYEGRNDWLNAYAAGFWDARG